jgi:uncharacterized membrane protein
MSTETVLIAGALLLMSVLWHVMPGLTRVGLFFAVTVDPTFRHTATAQRIVRRYRTIVWGFAAAAILLEVATGFALAALLLQATGFVWAMVSSHTRGLVAAVSPSPIVVERDLAPLQEPLPGGPIAAFLPLASLGILGLWTVLQWNRMPHRLPVHWGLHGVDRWVTTTPWTMFGLLAIQAIMCLLLIGIAWSVLHWSRRISTSGTGADGERRFRRRVVQLLLVTGYFLPVPAWFAVFQPPTLVLDVWGFALGTVIVGFTVSLLRLGQGGSRNIVATADASAGDRTPDDCWKWGLIYVNPADPSILVEKRFGIGYTVNFGNPWSWLILASVVASLVMMPVLLH